MAVAALRTALGPRADGPHAVVRVAPWPLGRSGRRARRCARLPVRRRRCAGGRQAGAAQCLVGRWSGCVGGQPGPGGLGGDPGCWSGRGRCRARRRRARRRGWGPGGRGSPSSATGLARGVGGGPRGARRTPARPGRAVGGHRSVPHADRIARGRRPTQPYAPCWTPDTGTGPYRRGVPRLRGPGGPHGGGARHPPADALLPALPGGAASPASTWPRARTGCCCTWR